MSKTYRVFLVVLLSICFSLFALSCSIAGQKSSQVPAKEIWFEDLTDNKPVAEFYRKTVSQTICKAILRNETPYLPAVADTQPRMIFLSVSDGSSAARVFHAKGHGIRRTALRLISDTSSKIKAPPQWVKIDYVQGISARIPYNSQQYFPLPSYLWGVAFPQKIDIAFLPGEVFGHYLITRRNRINKSGIVNYLETRGEPTSSIKSFFHKEAGSLRRFQTASYFASEDYIQSLQYGKEPIGTLSAETLHNSLEKAGQYLTRSVQPNGRFDYLYDPTNDKVPDTYNMVRHAGATFAMFQLAQFSGDAELSHAAQQASQFLVRHMRKPTVDTQEGMYVAFDGKAKLGTNALAILAFVKQSQSMDSQKPLEKATQLAQWIASIQTESGRLGVHRQLHPSGRKVDYRCEYYPGEVIFALTRLYQETGNELWLTTSERLAHFLITERDKGKSISELPHDHWLLYGLNELHRLRPNEIYLEHMRRITQAITNLQNTAPRNPAWHGSYYSPPRSAPTATRTEGLLAAFALETDHGRPEEAQKCLKAARQGVRFQLKTQITPPTAMYFPNPQRSLGGFTFSLNDPRIRIDVIQHNISSMISMIKVMQSRN